MTGKRFLLLGALLLVPLFGSPRTRADDEKKFNLIYVPTEEKVIEKMFDMAKVNKKDVLFDLGCGDGRICAMACKQFGCAAVGVDLDPERIKECMDTMKKYRVEEYGDPKCIIEYRVRDSLHVPDCDR